MFHMSSFHFCTHLTSFTESYEFSRKIQIFVELFDKHAGFGNFSKSFMWKICYAF